MVAAVTAAAAATSPQVTDGAAVDVTRIVVASTIAAHATPTSTIQEAIEDEFPEEDMMEEEDEVGIAKPSESVINKEDLQLTDEEETQETTQPLSSLR